MRDGINLARLDIASVALVTEEFMEQAAFIARSAGMPSAPRYELPHPVAGTGAAAMSAVARDVAASIGDLLAGSER